MSFDSDVITQKKINELSEKNKAFQNKFNQVAGIINKNQSYLKGVQDLDKLDPDQKLALKCLKGADFDLDKAINTFMIRKGEGQGDGTPAASSSAASTSTSTSTSKGDGAEGTAAGKKKGETSVLPTTNADRGVELVGTVFGAFTE